MILFAGFPPTLRPRPCMNHSLPPSNGPLVNLVLTAMLERAAGCVAAARHPGPTWDCPRCGVLHRAEEVQAREVDETCVYVCRRTGAVVREAEEDLPF